MSYPTTPDAVNGPWLAQVFGRAGADISVADIQRIGTGQVARSFRLTLDHDQPDLPRSLVMKCPTDDPGTLMAAAHYQLYRTEVLFYDALEPHTSVRAPQCYFKAISDDGLSFCLLLEDCAPARQGDQIGGASADDIRAALSEAARLHGAFAGERLALAERLAAVPKPPTEIELAQYRTHWPAFRARYADRLDLDILALGDDLLPHYGRFLDYQSAHPSVAHQDFRIDNLLFGAERVVVLDWQTMNVGPPLWDVAYLIGTSLRDRKSHEAALLQHYHQESARHGYTGDADALRRDYRVGALCGFAVAVGSAMLVERTERGDEMFAVMAERPARHAIELESLEAL